MYIEHFTYSLCKYPLLLKNLFRVMRTDTSNMYSDFSLKTIWKLSKKKGCDHTTKEICIKRTCGLYGTAPLGDLLERLKDDMDRLYYIIYCVSSPQTPEQEAEDRRQKSVGLRALSDLEYVTESWEGLQRFCIKQKCSEVAIVAIDNGPPEWVKEITTEITNEIKTMDDNNRRRLPVQSSRLTSLVTKKRPHQAAESATSLPSLNDIGFLWYAGLLAQFTLLVLACYALWVYRCKVLCLSTKTMKRRDSAWPVEFTFRRKSDWSVSNMA